MLREITAVQQDANGFLKRWFTSEEFDLYVWVKRSLKEQNYSHTTKKNIAETDLDSIDNKFEKFDLFYKKLNDEIAISWHQNSGFRYFKVDNESHSGKHPKSPIMVETSGVSLPDMLEKFEQELSEIDYRTASFIVEKLALSAN